MKVGSLFSGIGGIDLGFQQMGFDIVWANDFDRDACKTYRLNFPDTVLYEGDVRKLDAQTLSKVDIVSAGFPCQPFSVCGNQKGFKDNRGNLFFEILRIVDVIRPKIIFLENVANITVHDKGHTFSVIYNELVKRDYYVRYLVADACEYGVPQHRTRTYLLAFNDVIQCENFRFPQKTELKQRIFDIIDKSIKANNSFYLNENSIQFSKIAKAITDDNQIYRFSDYGIQAGNDGICFTLKANMGTWYNRIPIIRDNYGIREITPYECLALMGFPKDFLIANIPIKSAYKQIGNSVCVPIIKMIADRIQK